MNNSRLNKQVLAGINGLQYLYPETRNLFLTRHAFVDAETEIVEKDGKLLIKSGVNKYECIGYEYNNHLKIDRYTRIFVNGKYLMLANIEPWSMSLELKIYTNIKENVLLNGFKYAQKIKILNK